MLLGNVTSPILQDIKLSLWWKELSIGCIVPMSDGGSRLQSEALFSNWKKTRPVPANERACRKKSKQS